MLTQRVGLSDEQANRALDVQAKAGDIGGKLLEKLGRGLSQVSFDNAAGRFVVKLSPTGDAAQARALIAGLGLDTSEAVIERSDLDYVQHTQLAHRISARMRDVIANGHALVMTVSDGVEITVSAGATAAEQTLADNAAKDPNVVLKHSTKDSLTAHTMGCNGSFVEAGGLPGRYCDLLRGGSRWWESGRAWCSLGWWAGVPGDTSYSPWILTAGHCIKPGGTVWGSCTAAHTACTTPAGGEYGVRYGYGGDNGLLGVTTGRLRESGFTDWRNGANPRLTYLPGFYNSTDLIGLTVCHAGATTGYSCGTVAGVTPIAPAQNPPDEGYYPGTTYIDESVAINYICFQSGDSGGPVFTEDQHGGVGIVSASTGCGATGYVDPIKHSYDAYGVLPYGQ